MRSSASRSRACPRGCAYKALREATAWRSSPENRREFVLTLLAAAKVGAIVAMHELAADGGGARALHHARHAEDRAGVAGTSSM